MMYTMGADTYPMDAHATDGAIDLVRNTRISTGGFVLIVNATPELTKGYAFFVTMDDWLGMRRAVLDLIWFRLEDD